MKKLLSGLLAFICLVSLFTVMPANAEGLSVSAQSAVLIEAETKTVLFQKNAFVKLPMASTTKIMTALVAIENSRIDRKVQIDERARGVEGSSIYLAKNEVLLMKDLIYALLLASANDAAAAIAYEVAGSIESFAELMNQKATELGLSSTHFTNPHGLHDKEHYTTAYDLAVLTSEALKNEIFLEICSTKTKTIPLNLNEGTRYLTNHNKLLRSYKGCIGVKTGFTKASGRCLVSAAEREGLRLIAVTLNAPDDWRDHASMLDFGFDRYDRLTLAERGKFTTTFPVSGGTVKGVIVANSVGMSTFVKKDHGKITYKTEAIRPITAPIKSGEKLGRVVFYENEREISSSPLVAVTKVDRSEKKRGISEWLKKFFIR